MRISTLYSVISCCAWLAASINSGEAIAQAGTQRQPVPEAAAEQRAMALLREAFGREYDDAKTPAEKSALAKKPTDSEANQTVGSYLCLKKGDWENGIPMLALGTNAALKQLAQQELQDPTSPDEQAALGDRWWELAQSRDGPEKQSLLLRAGHWYREALPDLSSQLLKAKIEKRLEEIDKLASSASQRSARSRSRGKTQPKPHYLTTMQEIDVVKGPWPLGKFGKQGSRSDTPIAVKGVASQFGLGVHPPSNGHSSVKYQLGKKSRRFVTGAAVANGGKTSRSAITFLVLGDGKLLWISAPTRTEQVQICDVSVAGVDVLELRVECPGDNHLAWACWLDPYVIASPQ